MFCPKRSQSSIRAVEIENDGDYAMLHREEIEYTHLTPRSEKTLCKLQVKSHAKLYLGTWMALQLIWASFEG